MNKQQIIAVILIGLGLAAGTVLVYQDQKSRVKIEKREGIGSVHFQKGDGFDNLKAVDLVVSTGDPVSGYETSISSISIKAKIGDPDEEFSFVNNLSKPVEGIVIDDTIEKTGDWTFPLNKIFKKDGQYYLEFIAVNTAGSGFSSLVPVRIGTIFIESSVVEAPKITIVSKYTKMMSKGKPVIDILPK
ncbi:hypothetical protein JXA63_03335 [Candidatus Woesebacteria bacterium]|nr:hypothetical protein [Candidatus Woesebacteria bacterium]